MQLFPFLAVLVCAMGALILLLLVTTRKMQQVARARAAAEMEVVPSNILPPPPQPTGPELTPSGPTSDELADAEAQRQTEREARQEANAAAKRRQAEREAQWQRQLAEAEIARDQRRQKLDAAQAELINLQQRLQATETSLQKLHDKQSQLVTLQDHDSRRLAQAEQEHAELTAAILKAQKEFADLRRAHADSASKFAFIPYDGASGTTRRPIYIECTSAGIRFQPENELLDESDLKGFSEAFNPLLLASERLMQYWREKTADEDPDTVQRPYILLVVRPKGTVAYYVARKMLSQLGDNFGYELIEDDFPLQLPSAELEAKLVIQRAVAEALKNRGEMLASGGRLGEARLGHVVVGRNRNDELIEFGSLDDQVAADAAKQESPFARNSPTVGKAFSVTRSPVKQSEMVSGSLKSTLAERQRSRAAGTPDNLGTTGEHVSAPDLAVPGSLAEMTRGPAGTGTGNGPRNAAGTSNGTASLIPRSGPSGTGGAKAYALSDPFSREQLATGKHGAGSIDSDATGGEEVAGDSAGSGTGRTSTTSRGTAQRIPGIPQGSKPGKVIDIAPDATPISDSGPPGATAGDTGARTTPRAGQGERAESADASRSGSEPGSTTGNPPTGTTSAGRPPAGFTQSGAGGKSANGAGNIPDPFSPASSAMADGRQRAVPEVRSTDPNAAKNRVYGDNPEARKQLAALKSSKTATTTQKRDAGRQRWGGSNTGQIGFERKVPLQVMADKIVIGENDIEVVIEPGTTQDELVEAVLEALDEHSQTWGKPPTRFYWVPYVNFDVYSGGSNHYERLHADLRDWGIYSEVNFKPGDKPPATRSPNEKAGTIQPVSKTGDKAIGPTESPGKDTDKTPAARKPQASWFKRITQGFK